MLHHRLRMAGGAKKELTFVGAGTVNSGARPTVVIPSGVQAGDLLVLCVGSGGNTMTPSGWTLPTGAARYNASLARITTFYKVAGASESNFTLENSNSRTQCGVIAYRPTGGAATYVSLAANSGDGTVAATNTVSVSALPALIVSQFVKEPSTTPIGAVANTNQRLLGAGEIPTPLRVVDEFPTATGASTARAETPSADKFWETNALLFGVT